MMGGSAVCSESVRVYVANPLGFEPRITPPRRCVTLTTTGISLPILDRRFSFKKRNPQSATAATYIGWRKRQMTVRKSSGNSLYSWFAL